jgi:signal transduction histidine kinase
MDAAPPSLPKGSTDPGAALSRSQHKACLHGRPGRKLLICLVLPLAAAALLAKTAFGPRLQLATVVVAALLFGAIHLFVLRPLVQRLRQLDRDKIELERSLAQNASELCRTNAKLQAELELRRKAEANAEQLDHELEGRVSERTAQLEATILQFKTDIRGLQQDLDLCRRQLDQHKAQATQDKTKLEEWLAEDASALCSTNVRLQAELELRRKAEAHAEQLAQELEGRVSERTAQLEATILQSKEDVVRLQKCVDLCHAERANQEEMIREQRADAAATLASGLVHELNRSLAPVVLSAQLLRSKPLDREDLALVSNIETSAERCAELLREVLIFARGIDGERVSLDPGRLLKDVAAMARATFPSNIQVLTDVAVGGWSIKGDLGQLRKALLKLCVNARDAMPNGGALRLRAKDLYIKPSPPNSRSSIKPGAWVVFEVQDSGAGIPEAVRNKLFEPFFTTKDRAHAAGLGLSITQGIVRSHGGRIEVQSHPGRGAMFSVHLPAVRDDSAASAATQPDTASRKAVV